MLACRDVMLAPAAAGLPEVPAFIEPGHAEVESDIRTTVMLPAGTPARERLRAAPRQICGHDMGPKRAPDAAGSPIACQAGTAFERFFQADGDRLIRAVRRTGKVD